MTNNTIRNSKMAKILSMISESGIVEDIMKDFEKAMESKGLNMKSLFLKSLTPMGRETFKLAYQIINNEYVVLMEHESASIRDKWFAHFIEHHDNILDILKDGGRSIFEFAVSEYGDEYINNVFRKDERSLEELVDIVGEYYIKAKKQQKQHESELKEKLHSQLQDVVATLKEIANDDKANGFEIHMEGASFKIKTHNNEVGQNCVCGHCDEDAPKSFEDFMNHLFVGLNK